MVPPAVVVEMPAVDAGAPYASVLVQACTDGLRGGGTCALEEPSTEGAARARAYAIVSWDGSERKAATIEVGVRHGTQADWRTRRVTFEPGDAEMERWRSIGIIIATLVGGEPVADGAPSSPSRSPSPSPSPSPAHALPPPPARPEPPPRATPWFLEAAGALSRGAAASIGAWGVEGRAGAGLGAGPLFVTGSLRYESEAIAQAHLEWLWFGAGLGLSTPIGATPVDVEARCEPALAWARASASGATLSGALFGVREGVGLTWWWAPWLGPSLSIEALETTRSVVVDQATAAGTTSIARSQWFGWSGTLGLRFRAE